MHGRGQLTLADMCRLSASPAEQLLDSDGGSDAVSSPATSIFVMRDNPRQFFVRQPLPSTASAQTASPAPSKQPEEAPSEGTANEGKGKAKESKGKAKESKGKAKEGSQDGPTGQCSPTLLASFHFPEITGTIHVHKTSRSILTWAGLL